MRCRYCRIIHLWMCRQWNSWTMETAAPPPDNTWPFPFPTQDWGQTPPSVQAYIVQLQHDLRHLSARVEAIEARLNVTSATSNWPPPSEPPDMKARQRST